MSRWRLTVVAALLFLPVAFLCGAGALYLWYHPWGRAIWWGLLATMAAGYLLAWRWQSRRKLLPSAESVPPPHWTERDWQAWHLVEARARAADKLEPARLSDPAFFLETAQDMAQELAVFYYPRAADPLARLTLPEILAVVELAAHDLADMVDRYLPAGHLLTIEDWRRARRVTDWYQSAQNVYWVVSALFSPVNTGLRYLASRAGISLPLQMLQQNLLLWFYTAFLHRLGTYLIELHSGRLRVGATRYREILTRGGAPAPAPPDGDGAALPQARLVTVAIVGQTGAGKSSLINAFLGEQRARADMVPTTAGIDRYELAGPEDSTRLVLLDTPGYGVSGPSGREMKLVEEAARQADLMLVVLHARNPARQSDLDLLTRLGAWLNEHPELKRPPLVGVLTHIDLLSPSMEWSPPYNWQNPARPKEQNIRDALAATRESLGEHLPEVVPVCTAEGKVYGVKEWLLPALATRLDQAHAVALLRCLHQEIDTGKVRKVLDQLVAAGRELARAVFTGRR